jgi:hypothetical protein
MRTLLALLLLGALAPPALAHDCCCQGGYGYGGYRYGGGYRGGYRYGYRYYGGYRHGYGGWRRPYWHHPYYARFGYQRPYLYYRQLRYFGYSPYATWGGCGGWYYSYYPAFVSVAPVYSRLGVALTIDDPAFSKGGDPDGLPRARKEPVGSRFLGDAP